MIRSKTNTPGSCPVLEREFVCCKNENMSEIVVERKKKSRGMQY